MDVYKHAKYVFYRFREGEAHKTPVKKASSKNMKCV